jgi:hypothetical protein
MIQRYNFLFRYLNTLALVILFAGCRDIYTPEVEAQQGVLVVEGLISNLNERSFVKLTLAKQYYDLTRRDTAVTKAKVIIMEDGSVDYYLHEIDSGYYVTYPAEFIAKPGHTYSLQIVTAKGEKYQSTPQLMLPSPTIDSLYGEILEKEYIYKDVHGKTVGKMEAGAQTYIDFRSNTLLPVQYRFKSTLLVGSKYIDRSTSPYPSVIYVWEKHNPDNTINLTGSAGTHINLSVSAFPVSFYPFNEYLYDLIDDEHIENWFLQVRQYSLNQEAYQYYSDINKLLSSTGAIFDPIASQLSGNMTCISNPDRKVLGYFEVSGCIKTNFYIKPHLQSNIIDYSPCNDLDSITAIGKAINYAPYFWRF